MLQIPGLKEEIQQALRVPTSLPTILTAAFCSLTLMKVIWVILLYRYLTCIKKKRKIFVSSNV